MHIFKKRVIGFGTYAYGFRAYRFAWEFTPGKYVPVSLRIWLSWTVGLGLAGAWDCFVLEIKLADLQFRPKMQASWSKT